MFEKRSLKTALLAGVAISIWAAVAPPRANALNLYADNGITVNLSTTVGYSGAVRVNNPSAQLLNATEVNDGDQNLKHGLVSNQFEILPVLSVADGNLGLHLSGEAYLNTVYLTGNQNSSPNTLNYTYTNNKNYPPATTNVDGRNAELLDAFVYDSINFGAANAQSLTLKVGRQTLLWGQSLFFTNNGIAAGQAPIDINQAVTLANPQAQQIFLPVGQAVLTYQPNNWVTLQGYYQFEWRNDQFPGAGSYLSPVDFLTPGSNKFIAGQTPIGPVYFGRGKDITPPSSNGQFGLSAQFQLGNWDLGLYGLRFDEKSPQFYLTPFTGPPSVSSSGVEVGTYNALYAKDIQIYGASFSTTIGAVNVAGEISGRINQDLFSNPSIITPLNRGLNENSNPGYAVGDLVNEQASAIYVTKGLPFMPDGMTMLGEIEASSVVKVTANKSLLVPGRTPDAIGLQGQISPNYDDVLPHLDITFPIGLTWYPTGRSQFSSQMQAGTGQLNIGVSATYNSVWKAGLNYSDYLGSTSYIYPGGATGPSTPKQIYADRGFVSLYLSRTF